jgi:drug/metabolite transporter (DMT)-like permease
VEITPRASLALVFLILGGTVLGFGAYTWLLRVTSAAAVSTYAFVNPVIALGLAWVVGDGELSPRTGVAAALVVAAVIFTRERKGKRGRGAGETVLVRGGLAASLFSGYLRRARASVILSQAKEA